MEVWKVYEIIERVNQMLRPIGRLFNPGAKVFQMKKGIDALIDRRERELEILREAKQFLDGFND